MEKLTQPTAVQYRQHLRQRLLHILLLLLSFSFSVLAFFTGGFVPPQHKIRDAVILRVEFVSCLFKEALPREASPDAPLHIRLSVVERMRIEGELGHRLAHLWCITVETAMLSISDWKRSRLSDPCGDARALLPGAFHKKSGMIATGLV